MDPFLLRCPCFVKLWSSGLRAGEHSAEHERKQHAPQAANGQRAPCACVRNEEASGIIATEECIGEHPLTASFLSRADPKYEPNAIYNPIIRTSKSVSELRGSRDVIELVVDGNDTGEQLKKGIETKIGASVEDQTLAVGDRRLSNAKPLHEQGISDRQTIRLFVGGSSDIHDRPLPTDQNYFELGAEPIEELQRAGRVKAEMASTFPNEGGGAEECAVVVFELPGGQSERLRSAVETALSACGEITDIQIKSGSENECEHAVVTFSDGEGAVKALQSLNLVICDRKVDIVPLSSWHPPKNTTNPVSQFLGQALASGYTIGQDGLNYIRSIDDSWGVSATFQKAGAAIAQTTRSMDESAGLTENVKAGSNAVATKAGDLNEATGFTDRLSSLSTAVHDGVTGIDQRWGISEAAGSASAVAQESYKSVISAPIVEGGISSISSAFSAVATFTSQTVEETQARISNGNRETRSS